MLIRGFNDHFRQEQKNLFIGERFCVFANPSSPDDDATATQGQGGVGANPAAASILNSKLTDGVGSQNGINVPKDWLDAQQRQSELYKQTKEWVPEVDKKKGAFHQSVEIQEAWISAFSEYNGIQSYIDWLLSVKKRIQDTNLADDPNFKSRYRQYYKNLYQLKGIQELHLDGIDFDEIQNKINDDGAQTTKNIVEDLDKFINKMVERRKDTLEMLENKHIKKDFERRLEELKEKWKDSPPANAVKGSAEWIGYIEALEKALKKMRIPDKDDPALPQGREVLQEWRDFWGSLSQLEYSYDMFKEGDKADLNPDNLTAKFREVANVYETAFHGDLNKQYTQKVNQVLGPAKDVRDRLLEAYKDGFGPWKKEYTDAEKKAFLEQDPNWGDHYTEIATLNKSIASLEENLDLEKVFKDILFDDCELVDKDGRPAAARLPAGTMFTKGLEGQVNWLNNLSCDESTRRQLNFRMEQSLDKCKLQLNTLDNYLGQVLPAMLQRIQMYKTQMDTVGPSKKWEIVFLPIASYKEIGHTVSELFKRSYQRDTNQKIGKAGSQLFKPIEGIPVPTFLRPVTELSGEFAMTQEHAETEGYQHYVKHHENANVADKVHHMHETTNEFEFRGLMDLLAKIGRIRWDDEGLYKQLNHFQKVIPVQTNKQWHLENRSESESDIWRAITAIYRDQDIYRNWVTQNSSAIKSVKGEKKSHFGEISEVRGGLNKKIDAILAHYKHDKSKDMHFSEADPIEYEAIMEYGIEQGKLEGEDVVWYMIQGIGSGLLPIERGSEFTGMNNQYPAIEFFSEGTLRDTKPTLEDIEELALMDKETYIDYYHRVIMRMPKVRQRLQKALTQGLKLDHDYFTAFGPYANSTVIESLLHQGNDGFRLQLTAIQNGTEGMLMSFDTMLQNYDELKANGTFDLDRFVDTVVRFDAILNNQMYRNSNQYYRLSAQDKKEKPRSSGAYEGYYGRGGNTTGDNMGKLRDYFKDLDFDDSFPMLRKLFNNEFKTDSEVVDFASKLSSKHTDVFGKGVSPPKNLDELYKSVGAYISFSMEKYPSKLDALVKRVKEEHQTAFRALAAERKESIVTHRQKSEERMRKYREEVARTRQQSPEHWSGHGDHGKHNPHAESRLVTETGGQESPEQAAGGATPGGQWHVTGDDDN